MQMASQREALEDSTLKNTVSYALAPNASIQVVDRKKAPSEQRHSSSIPMRNTYENPTLPEAVKLGKRKATDDHIHPEGPLEKKIMTVSEEPHYSYSEKILLSWIHIGFSPSV